MNTHSLRSLLSRRNVAPLTLLFLFAVVVASGFTASVAQSPGAAGGGRGQRPAHPPHPSIEEIKKDFTDDDLKVKGETPGGKWTYATQLDSKGADPSVPAYVRSTQLLSGGGVSRDT